MCLIGILGKVIVFYYYYYYFLPTQTYTHLSAYTTCIDTENIPHTSNAALLGKYFYLCTNIGRVLDEGGVRYFLPDVLPSRAKVR